MQKLYYSISEVSEMLGISLSNLRFWEKEFKQLKPKRNSKNTRFYSEEDLKLIKQIQFLVDEQKLTLEGVKQRLSQKKDRVGRQQELAERLKAIRQELIGISKQLE